MKSKLPCLLIVLLTVGVLNAQVPDPSLWSGDTTNPSGEPSVPGLWLDNQTGIIRLTTLGLNQTNDTTGPSTIGGDDVGLISIRIEGPPAAERLLDGAWVNPNIGGELTWTAQHFAGQEQVFGVGTAEFLEPGNYDLFRYDPPLKACATGDVEIGVNYSSFAPGGILIGNAVAPLSGASSCQTLLFDFSGDYLLNCDDVDALVHEIATGSSDLQFDLNGDAIVDHADLDFWLLRAAEYNGDGFGYLPGDANLDGQVDVGDFNIWNQNKFTEAIGWCSGDFNADGVVDTSDFNLWNQNKFTSSARPQSVPEPAGLGLLLICALIPTLRKRRN